MPDAPDIAVKPLLGISPEEAHDVRARAWAFVFQCWQDKQKGGPATAPADAPSARNTEGVSHVDQRPH